MGFRGGRQEIQKMPKTLNIYTEQKIFIKIAKTFREVIQNDEMREFTRERLPSEGGTN